MKEYKYIFSIIVPLYNTGEYLEECFGSVVNQTIGFDKIQLILINDESPDVNDEKISLKYLNRYSNNIVYEKQKNTGEAGARNTGYKYIEGKYIGFLDADDKFGLDVFEKVYNYFEINYDKINLACIPVKNFEKANNIISRYIGFNETKILDIKSESKFCHPIMWNYFYKYELIKDNYSDKNLLYGNDMKLINYILLNEVYYGYVADCYYFYRVRINNSSGTNKFRDNSFYYGKYMFKVFYFLIDESIKIYGEVIEYIQNLIYINIRGLFLVNNIKKNLLLKFSDEEKVDSIIKNSFESIYNLVQFISDEVMYKYIKSDKDVFSLFILNFKHKLKDTKTNKIDVNYLIQKQVLSGNIEEYCFLKYERLNLDENEKVVLEFSILCPLNINIRKILGQVVGFQEEAVIHNIGYMDIWDETCLKTYYVILKMDLDKCKGMEIRICIDIENKFYLFNKVVEIK